MRQVHIKDVPVFNPVYNFVPQPMWIYHSTEEFEANMATIEEEGEVHRVTSFGNLCDTIVLLGKNPLYNAFERQINMTKLNVWVKTEDKFIPDHADMQGNVYYKEGEDGQPIPTDACWIKLYFIQPMFNQYILYCSNGMTKVSVVKWDITGAVRPNYAQEKDSRIGMTAEQKYNKEMEKLQRRRAVDVKMYKFASHLFDPRTPYFLNVKKLAKQIFPFIKMSDIPKIFESEVFRRAMMEVYKTLNPDIRRAVVSKIPPEKVADMLLEMVEGTVKNPTTSTGDKIDVMKFLLSTGYEETTTVNDMTRVQLPTSNGTPQIADNKSMELPVNASILNAAGIKTEPKVTLDVEEFDTDSSDMSEDVLKEIMEDLDYPDGFIQKEDN